MRFKMTVDRWEEGPVSTPWPNSRLRSETACGKYLTGLLTGWPLLPESLARPTPALHTARSFVGVPRLESQKTIDRDGTVFPA
jgi:hypothetical protein